MVRPQMWTADFDYVRLTHKQEGDYEAAKHLYERARIWCVASGTEGEVRDEAWQALGYRGRTSGLAQVGEGREGLLLQASQWAAANLRELPLPYTGVPRVDVAVTVWYDADPAKLVEQYAERSSGTSRLAGGSAWKVTHIRGYGNGDTTYLGSRTSDIYVRIYDKGRESAEGGHYQNALRYEVEYKGQAASRIWEGAHRLSPGRDWLASQVLGVLRTRGVYVALGDFLPRPNVRTRENSPSSSDKRLAWLRTQVAPSIDKLLADGVSLAHVKEALGLA